jgi:hypothetical protein
LAGQELEFGFGGGGKQRRHGPVDEGEPAGHVHHVAVEVENVKVEVENVDGVGGHLKFCFFKILMEP